MKKYIPYILIAALILLIIFLSFQKETAEQSRAFYETKIGYADRITCSYPLILTAQYRDDEIIHILPKPETRPIIFTFTNLSDENIGQLSYLDATNAITNVPLVKLIENSEKIVYVEGTGENYITIHTIYKEKGISTYTKNVNLIGTPVVSASMGNCSNY